MLTCKDVCEQATEHLEGETTAWQRFALRFHLLICRHCRRFLRQFRLTVDTAAHLSTATDPTDADIDALLTKLKQN